MNVKRVFTTCFLKIIAVRHWTIRRRHAKQRTISTTTTTAAEHCSMDTLTPIVQMSDEKGSVEPLKKHLNDHINDGGGGGGRGHEDDDFIDSHIYEVDENQQNNGLKRQRSSECAKNHSKLPPTQQQLHQQKQQQKQQKCTYEQKVRCKLATEASVNGRHHQSNGFHRDEDNKIDGNRDDDDANFLTKFCENHNQNDAYFDTPKPSDLCDAKIRSTDAKNHWKMETLNGNAGDCADDDDDDEMRSDRVVTKGRRRTRALSTDAIQTELYETRKQQQQRLRSQTTADSEVSI